MTKLLYKYRGFFAFVLKHEMPSHRRLPVREYFGEMALVFIRCVHLWDGSNQFTTYLFPSLRGAIRRQRREERLISLKSQTYAACPLAANSYRWNSVREPPSDRRWNGAEHVVVQRESDPWPDWYSAELLELWLKFLPPRVAHSVERLLDGVTYNVIGRELRVTRERARQIAQNGLRQLCNYVQSAESYPYCAKHGYWRREYLRRQRQEQPESETRDTHEPT